jgi:quinoprotein glucose dehydrogenase
LFTPPSTQGTISSPGHNGGPLWGGGAFDPETGWLYVSHHDQPSHFVLTRAASRSSSTSTPLQRGRRLYRTSCAACHGRNGKGLAEAPGIVGPRERFDPAAFVDVVRHGKGRMPPSAPLSDIELELLGDYVRGLDETEAQTDDVAEADEAVRFTTPWTFFRDSTQLPAVRPPWGRLTAIDMATGDVAWESLVGDEESVTQRGLPATGHKYLKGGPVVTAGGLVFMAGTQDRSLRAFDKRTGARLWTGELPFDSTAVPAVYEIAGKQYVAICAMASRGDDPGDAVVAFALPDEGAPE